jgi:predicted ester cyclase
MDDFLTRLMSLWTQPLPADDVALAAFREFYADPVLVNGSPLTAAQLIERAKVQQRAFAELTIEIVDRVLTADKVVVAFIQRALHKGPLATPLGDVPASGQRIERQVMDILTMRDGKVSEIRVVGDELGLLLRLDAVALKR